MELFQIHRAECSTGLLLKFFLYVQASKKNCCFDLCNFWLVSQCIRRSSTGIVGVSLVAEENLEHIEMCHFVLAGES